MRNSAQIFFLIAVFTIFSLKSQIKCDYWEYKLIHDLLDGYDPSIRPSEHHNASLNVTFGLALVQLIDVVIKFNSRHFFNLKN